MTACFDRGSTSDMKDESKEITRNHMYILRRNYSVSDKRKTRLLAFPTAVIHRETASHNWGTLQAVVTGNAGQLLGGVVQGAAVGGVGVLVWVVRLDRVVCAGRQAGRRAWLSSSPHSVRYTYLLGARAWATDLDSQLRAESVGGVRVSRALPWELGSYALSGRGTRQSIAVTSLESWRIIDFLISFSTKWSTYPCTVASRNPHIIPYSPY